MDDNINVNVITSVRLISVFCYFFFFQSCLDGDIFFPNQLLWLRCKNIRHTVKDGSGEWNNRETDNPEVKRGG